MSELDEKVFAEDKASYVPVFQRYHIVLDHGKGTYLWDVDGKKYLDFLGGIAVNVLGHDDPELVWAITEQAHKMIHCSNLYYTQAQADAAARLVELSGLDKAFFGNSGAEANEGAIKIARKWATAQNPDKVQIITARMSFHGRTYATLTATGQPHYQQGLGPVPGGFTYVDYNNIEELEQTMSENTCAVMLETIQGEGGVYTPAPGYLQQVRALCDKYHALLILDEIQAGIGRSGKFFAYENYGIKPDIVTLAKGLAGGVPIGAFIVKEEVAQAFGPGDHGTTFGGNPLAMRAALETLRIAEEDGLLANAARVGEVLKGALAQALAGEAGVKEIRGQGLMLGIELDRPCGALALRALQAGLLISVTAGNVVRLVPPLILSEAEAQEVVQILAPLIINFLHEAE